MAPYSTSDMFPRLQGEPVEVRWAGFKSDTLTLQRAGWEFVAEQNIYQGHLTIIMRLRGSNIKGMGRRIVDYPYMEPRYAQRMPVVVEMEMAGQVIATMMDSGHMYSAINTEPCYVMEQRSLDDLLPFQKVQKSQHEVVIQPASMAEILEMALERQEPEQQRIREQMLKNRDREEYLKKTTSLINILAA